MYSYQTKPIIVKKLEIAVGLYKIGKFEEALVHFNELVSEDPKNTEYMLFRGRILSRLGELDRALNDFETITGMEPHNTDFISDKAVVLHLMKRNEEALAAFNKALNLDPQNPYRYSSRAYFKDRIGDLQGSIDDYEKAIQMDPEDAVSYNNKGLVEEKLGYQQRAKKSFNRADELVGYKPKETEIPQKNPEDLPTIGGKEDSQEAKINLKNYLSTVKDVFTDANTRKEFFDFLFRKKN